MSGMSRVIYEGLPVVRVPLVRDWFTPWCDKWSRFFWGRRGTVIVWGFFFWLYGCWFIVKAMLWLSGIIVAGLVYGIWAVAECCTYKRRKRRATQQATW